MMQSLEKQSSLIYQTQTKLISIILKPIIGILLRAGVPYQIFSSLARRLYVDIARDDFGIRGRKTNVSRVAMLTGLSRTMVRAALDEEYQAKDFEEPTKGLDSLRHLSRLLLGWYVDDRFLDENGQPAALEVEGSDGAIGFDTLYNEYSGKLAPSSAMLKELIEVGSVEQLADGRVVARSRQYIPRRADAANLERVCQVINDLAETGGYNLHRRSEDQSRFERISTNQKVPASKEAEFRAFLESEGQQFLENVDDWLSQNEHDDADEPSKRIGVGVYQISSDPINQEET